MKRRDVIKLGAVAAGASVGVPGCAVPKLLGALHGADGAAAFNALLDDSLGKLDSSSLLHRMVESHTKKKLSAEATAAIADKDALFRRVLGTVLITQAFRELPKETQVEPAVQDRMWKHFDQIGSTVFDITDMLASLDPTQRAKVRTTLQEQPDLPMELGEMLDVRAQRVGMSTTRRLQLRKMMAQTAFRLKNGHASSMIDEYVTKVDKLRTTDERNAAAIDFSSKLGERAFWRHQHLVAGDQPGAQAPPAGPPGQLPAQPPPPAPQPPPPPAQPVPQVPAGPPVQEPMQVLLHKSARSAAKRGDCRAIEILGKRVRELDAEYYRTAFATDPVLINCRPGTVIEQPLPQTVAPPPTAPAGPIEKPAHPGSKGLSTGGYLFGIGLLVGLGSLLLVSVESDIALIGLFGLTAAVILVGLGLIILLISALIYVTND